MNDSGYSEIPQLIYTHALGKVFQKCTSGYYYTKRDSIILVYKIHKNIWFLVKSLKLLCRWASYGSDKLQRRLSAKTSNVYTFWRNRCCFAINILETFGGLQTSLTKLAEGLFCRPETLTTFVVFDYGGFVGEDLSRMFHVSGWLWIEVGMCVGLFVEGGRKDTMGEKMERRDFDDAIQAELERKLERMHAKKRLNGVI